jgi:hypothetical protein
MVVREPKRKTESVDVCMRACMCVCVYVCNVCMYVCMCSRITSTESLSFCMTTFSASLTILKTRLPLSHDCSCYVSRRSVAPAWLWLQKHTDARAQFFAHSPDVWHQLRLGTLHAIEAGDFVEIFLQYLYNALLSSAEHSRFVLSMFQIFISVR